MRWEVTSAPSAAPYWNAQAPGAPRWQAELFRARAQAPGAWLLAEEQGGLKVGKICSGDDGILGNWTAGLRQRRPLRRA